MKIACFSKMVTLQNTINRVPSHIVHLSCAEAIPIIARAKKDGVPITG
jgi:dihydroorotase-like cyclic amidohydrolase